LSDALRYDRVAICLHWLMALAIVVMLVLGFVMEDLSPLSTRIAAFQFHKSLGLTILALALVRLVWRLLHPAPAYPAGMKAWERLAAEFTHGLLYACMVLIPLTGWLLISTSKNRFPTHYFGTFEVPLLGGFADSHAVHELTEALHYWFAIGIIGLIGLHLAGALKHRIVYKDTVFTRMMPGFLLYLATRRNHA